MPPRRSARPSTASAVTSTTTASRRRKQKATSPSPSSSPSLSSPSAEEAHLDDDGEEEEEEIVKPTSKRSSKVPASKSISSLRAPSNGPRRRSARLSSVGRELTPGEASIADSSTIESVAESEAVEDDEAESQGTQEEEDQGDEEDESEEEVILPKRGARTAGRRVVSGASSRSISGVQLPTKAPSRRKIVVDSDEEDEDELMADSSKARPTDATTEQGDDEHAKDGEDEEKKEEEESAGGMDVDKTPAPFPRVASTSRRPLSPTADGEGEPSEAQMLAPPPQTGTTEELTQPDLPPPPPPRLRLDTDSTADAEEADRTVTMDSPPPLVELPPPTPLAGRTMPSQTPRIQPTPGPSQSQPAPKPKPRLTIHKLVLVNFKSYADRQEIGPFHKSFSAIVGPNGSGKSNTIDALLFVFGYRASKMRQGKLSELIHNSAGKEGIESCSVEVWFREIVDLVRQLRSSMRPTADKCCSPESTISSWFQTHNWSSPGRRIGTTRPSIPSMTVQAPSARSQGCSRARGSTSITIDSSSFREKSSRSLR